MIKYCIEQWNENKNKLRKAIEQNIEKWNAYSYENIVSEVVKCIFQKEVDGYNWDYERITEIDDGDYQGTLLFLIPLNKYQPSVEDYLVTFVWYGSCSGCDTLQAIHYDYECDDAEENKKRAVKQYMQLCKDIVTNTKKLYNDGWRYDASFEEIKGEKQ